MRMGLIRGLRPVAFVTAKTSTRPFSSTSRHLLKSTELQDSHLKTIRADASRLWNDIHETAKFGTGKRYGSGAEQTGLSRLALSSADKQARDWFVKMTKGLDCDVEVDEIGNVFAIRKGLNNDLPPTFVGSHFDSQPNGGRFDGVLGVCAGIEMLRVLNENWIETEGPVGVVNWTNEEGSRWTKSMMGSSVWASASKRDEVYALQDKDGVTVKSALKDIGYLGEVGVGWGGEKMAGHFELHIEQGKILEKNDEIVGIVTGAQAYKWFSVTVKGQEGHAGATAAEDRCDALRAATGFLTGLYKIMDTRGNLVTVGTISVEQGSINTIPGTVKLTVDLRHRTDDGLQKLVQQMNSLVASLLVLSQKEWSRPVAIECTELFHSPAVQFNELAVKIAKEGVKNVIDVEEPREMISGAGHDSINTDLHCPTAMVFVRCKDGITHNPEEWCSKEDAKVGTDVLIESVLRFDRAQAET